MLRDKSTTIVSEIKDFFTTSEKAANIIFSLLSSLTFSEKHLGIESKCNNSYKNADKLLLLVLFPIFNIKDAWQYKQSTLYHVLSCKKDVFYRMLNHSGINWKKIAYRINIKLINKTQQQIEVSSDTPPRCLIIDDTDLPKTGRCIELIGRVFSHVTHQSTLAFKGLFMGYHDGKSLFALDFSIHGEEGKNKKKPYGLTPVQLKKRYSKQRDKKSAAYLRKQEYFTTKIHSMILMIRTAITQGLRFDYVLVDSWFTCFELVLFVKTRRISCHLLGMAKMGKTKYLFNDKMLTAKEIVDFLRRTKKLKRSKLLACYYCEAIVKMKGIEIKLFFSKTSHKGNWCVLLTTDLLLNYQEAYKIYSIRWSIEVFFKESKQYLGLGKCQSQDFDAQIATTTICLLQYNILSVYRRFADYESFGALFRQTNADTLQLTVNERIWKIMIEIVALLAEMLELDSEMLMGKLVTENERFEKILNYTTLLKAG